MNPDDPSEPHLIPVGDAELEARIVAWVLGEASAFEAAELERLCEETPELRLFEQRIRSLHSLVKEDFHPLPGEAWRLSPEKREKVTALFGDAPVSAGSERQRKVNLYFTRRALLATAACLAVTAAVSWPYFSRSRNGVAGEKKLAGAGSGDEMSPEQQQRYYDELQKAVKTQEDTVEDKRQALQTIIRTEGVVYDPTRPGQNAFGDSQTADAASKAYVEVEQSRVKHESEIEPLLNYDGERLIQYATGLDLPDNLTKTLYPEYLAAKRKLEAEKNEQGLSENHAAVVAQQQIVDGIQKDLDHSVENLRSVLKAKLDLDKETLRRIGERRNVAKSDAIKQSVASASFEDAQKDFQQKQRILEQLKLKQMEVGAQVAAGGKPGGKSGEVALGLADMADSKSASALAAEVHGRESGGDVRAGRLNIGGNVKPAEMPSLARSDENEAKLPADLAAGTLPPAPPAPAKAPMGTVGDHPIITAAQPELPQQSVAGSGSGGGSGGGLGSGSGSGLGSGRGPGELSQRSKTERPAAGSADRAIPATDLAKDVPRAPATAKTGLYYIPEETTEPLPLRWTAGVPIGGSDGLTPSSTPESEELAKGDGEIRREMPLKESLSSRAPRQAAASAASLAAGVPKATATNATGIVTSGLRSGSGEISRNNIDAILNNPGSTAEKDAAPGVVALTGQFNDAFADSADALQMPQGAVSDDLYGQSHLKPSEVGFGYIMRGSSDDGRRAGDQNDGPMTYTGFGLSSLGREQSFGEASGTRYFRDLGRAAQQLDLTKEYADHSILAGAEYRLRDSDVISAPSWDWRGDQAVLDLVGTLEYRYSEPDYATGAATPRFKSRGYNELESLESPQDFLFPPLPNSLPNPALQELKSPPADPAPEKPKEPDLKEISAADEAFSTFSLHVSDVSFRLAKAALDRGERPDPASIREEEFYNAVEYGDPATAKDEPVACVVEQSAHPVRPQRDLVRVGIRTGSSGRAAATPLNLVLLLDSSGSMERDDRHAGLVKAVQELSSLLKEGDTITVVGFSRKPRLLADRLPGADAAKLNEIIANSPIEGGTDLAQGLKLAGELAERQFQPKAQNRVVLFTDGAANLGDADPQSLAKMIVQLRGKHIAFDAAGFGAEGLNDKLLEQLTRDGDGRYYVVNRPEDAGDQFAKQLAGAFRPAAENVKVQVRFNAARVGKYRLTGFAEHRLQTEDFHNDSVDAAEMAAEEAGNALYEVEPLPEGEGEIGEVSVRFRNAATGEMVERTWTIPYEPQSPAFDKARPSMQLAGLALLTAEKLQGGAAADAIDFNTMATVMASVRQVYGSTAGAAQLLEMIGKLR